MPARSLAAPVLAAVALALTACAAELRPRPSPRQIVRASGLVRPGDPWPTAYLALQDRLGPPTRVAGHRYAWAARVGDDCYLIEVAVHDDVVIAIDDAHRRTPSRGGYHRCADAAR